jgi:hypothetical protein
LISVVVGVKHPFELMYSGFIEAPGDRAGAGIDDQARSVVDQQVDVARVAQPVEMLRDPLEARCGDFDHPRVRSDE